MKFQNYVWNIEESHKHLLKNTISKGQYEREIYKINERMLKSGFSAGDRSNALNEGEKNAIYHFNINTSNK